jgi:archaellum component FlaG (FlaF/FlaG flagellin family)
MGLYTIEVTTEVKNVVPYNSKRVVLVLFNVGGNTIYLSENQVRVLEEGIPLSPGANVSFLKVDGDDPRIAWYACTATGTSELRVYEGFEVKW